MNEDENDYDRIESLIQESLQTIIGNSHEPYGNSDSITITKNGFISGVIKLQRLSDWVKGLSKTHKSIQQES